MSDAAKPADTQAKSGLTFPGFAQLQRLGKSLMLPIAVLPAAGILLRLGQPDLLGRIETPVIGDFFKEWDVPHLRLDGTTVPATRQQLAVAA